MALSVFEAIDPSLTISATRSRGRTLVVTDWPHGTDDVYEQRILREQFPTVVTERAPVADQINVITNPSFETGLHGWTVTPFGGATVDRFEQYAIPDLEDEYWFEGEHAGHVSITFPFSSDASATITSPSWDVVPGQLWSIAMTIDLREGVSNQAWRIEWLNASGVSIGFSPAQDFTTEVVHFREQDVQAAPAGAAKGRIHLKVDAVLGGAWWFDAYLDGAIAAMTGGTVDYFDGDTTPGNYAWLGEPHASASYLWH
jgi:hypothetical protein